MFATFFIILVIFNNNPNTGFPIGSDENFTELQYPHYENPEDSSVSSNETEVSEFETGYIQFDDMILPEDVTRGFNITTLNVIADKKFYWTNNQIPYVIDSSLSSSEIWMKMIQAAFNEYHTKTCIRFVPWKSQKNYINIMSGTGCASYVGMQNIGKQSFYIGEGCKAHGIIVHELGHALGFFHEQNREDRDDYINIFWENISPGLESQFQKVKPEEERLITPYDIHSVMHYGEVSFSKDGVSKTMTAKSGQKLLEIYEKSGLSAGDVKEINTIYKCGYQLPKFPPFS